MQFFCLWVPTVFWLIIVGFVGFWAWVRYFGYILLVCVREPGLHVRGWLAISSRFHFIILQCIWMFFHRYRQQPWFILNFGCRCLIWWIILSWGIQGFNRDSGAPIMIQNSSQPINSQLQNFCIFVVQQIAEPFEYSTLV